MSNLPLAYLDMPYSYEAVVKAFTLKLAEVTPRKSQPPICNDGSELEDLYFDERWHSRYEAGLMQR